MFGGWLSLEKTQQVRNLTKDIDVKCGAAFGKALDHYLPWAMQQCVRCVVLIKACGLLEVIHIWSVTTTMRLILW